MRPEHSLMWLCLAVVACHGAPTHSDDAARATDAARARHDAGPPDTTGEAATASPVVDAGSPDVPSVDAGPPSRRVTLAATGDLTITPRVANLALDHRSSGRMTWVLGRAGSLFNPHDIAYADLETPLATRYRTPGSGRLEFLGAPPEFARDLAHVGLDVVSVATNHAYDQTGEGMSDTLDALHSAGITVIGAAEGDALAYQPTILEREGVRIAFLGFTTRTNDGAGDNPRHAIVALIERPARALAAVRVARASSDIVVVGVHWGRDFSPSVSESQRVLAHQLLQAGADVVLGSGPHIVQRVERVATTRGEAVVAYSLGNAVSNHGFRFRPGRIPNARDNFAALDDPRTRDGVVLHITLEAPATGGVHIVALAANALWTTNTEEEIRVLPLRNVDEDLRADRLREINRALGPAVRARP